MIHDDPVYPGLESRFFRIVRGEVRDDLYQYLLGDVAGIIVVHDHLERDVVNPCLVAYDQLLQGMCIAVQ